MGAERIGVKILDPLELIEADRFRRDLMLVDKLAIDFEQLELARRAAGSISFLHGKDPDQLLKRFDDDLDHLDNLGLIRNVALQDAELPEDLQKTVNAIDVAARRELEKGLHAVKGPDGARRIVDPVASYALNRVRADLHRARHVATTQSTLQQHLIPIATGRLASLFDRTGGAARVLRVVLSSLPTPSADTDWDDIMAFRTDPQTKLKLARLRSWMTDMAVTAFDEQQIQSRLEAALAEYRAHMHLHRIKAEASTAEVLVVTTAEVLENALRLRFSEAARKLFQLFKEDCALTEAELKMPGKEVAFIHAAAERFPG